jgi:hypothetical protein
MHDRPPPAKPPPKAAALRQKRSRARRAKGRKLYRIEEDDYGLIDFLMRADRLPVDDPSHQQVEAALSGLVADLIAGAIFVDARRR